MATVDIRLDGVSITDDVLYEQTSFGAQANGQPGVANVIVKNVDGKYTPSDFVMGMTLELYIDGTREWDGWIFDMKRTWPFEVMDTTIATDVPKFWKLRGFDRNILFQKRFMYDQNDPDNENGLPEYAAGTTDQAVLLDVYNNYVHTTGLGLSTSGIKSVASPGQGGDFLIGYVGAPWGTAFDDCAKMSGAVFYIDPDRVIHYRGDTDVNSPYLLTDAPWAFPDGLGYTDFMWWEDFTEAATDALVWGAGYGSRFPVFSRYQSNVGTYGRWQWGDIFTGAYKQATVDKRAETYVDGSPSNHRGHGQPLPAVTLTLFQPGLRCGMVTYVQNNVHLLVQALPVTKLNITFPSPSAPRFDYELTLKIDEPFSSPDLWQSQNWTIPNDPVTPTAPPDPPTYEITVPGGDLLIDHYDDTWFESIVASSGQYQKSDFAQMLDTQATEFTSAATSFDIPIPDGCDASTNRTLILFWAGGDGAPTVPTGWTSLDADSYPTEGMATYVAYRHLDGTEGFTGTGDSVSITAGSSITGRAIVALIGNSDQGTAPEVQNDTNTSGSGNSGNLAPSWGSGKTLWLANLSIVGDISIYVDPSSFVKDEENERGSSGVSVALSHRAYEAASYDPGGWSHATTARWNTYFVAVKPAAAATVTIPIPRTRTVGQFLVLHLASDDFDVLTPEFSDLNRQLEDDGWIGMGSNGSNYYSADVAGKVIYKRIDGSEPDNLEFVPYNLGASPSTYWACVATVSDWEPHDVDTDYVNAVQWQSDTSYAGVSDPTAPADGDYRLYITVFNNSGAVTDIPAGWTLVSQSYIATQIGVFVYSIDVGAMLTSDTYSMPAGPAFTGAVGLLTTLVTANDVVEGGGEQEFQLVTPGPSVTEAPWAGGNPYHRTYSLDGVYAVTENSIIRRDGATTLQIGLYDMDRFMIDDTAYWGDPLAIPGTDYSLVDPGYYHDGYPASGFSTRYWAAQEGFDDVIDGDGLDIIIKWRYTGLSSIPVGARMDVYVELASIPDDQDQYDCYLLAMFLGWGNTEADTYIQSWINIWNNYNGPDGGVVWPYHSYYYDALGPSPQVFEADTWYYTRVKIESRTAENQWGHPHVTGHSDDFHDTGHAMAMLKSWPVTEEEPTSGVKGPFSWYWNGPASSYPDVFNGEESAYTIDGWDIMLPVQWELNGWDDGGFDYNEYIFANHLEVRGRDAGAGRFEVDAIWRYAGGTQVITVTGVTTDAVAEQPLFIEANTTLIPYYATYETQYPYEPGTLQVFVGGTLQGPGTFGEQDPASGRFLVYHYGDHSADMYVTYTRTSSEANHESTGVYRPAPVLQYGWGSELDGFNCNMAAGCMALDRHTLGVKTSTPPVMRSYQYDQSGGTDLGDLATAWINGYSETLEHGVYSWAQFAANVQGGRGAVLQGVYGNLPSEKRFSDTFTGGHSIYINEELSPGQWRGQDPLTAQAVVYTTAELQAYAEGLSWVAADQVSAGFTQVTS